jgi:UPF0755 protein
MTDIFLRKLLLGLAVLCAAGTLFTSPPGRQGAPVIATVTPGESAYTVAETLAQAGVVRHAGVFALALRLTGNTDSIHAGQYLFEAGEEGMLEIAHRLSHGTFNTIPVTLTFPEGISVREMAVKIEKEFGTGALFVEEAAKHEGFLFPDTYRFWMHDTPEAIISAMRARYAEKIAPFRDAISASGHSEKEIITMASLLEKEARTPEVRQILAGILWERIRLGMPLQVDAVFGYIFNRATYSPSFADLKVDSPYNTYLHKGLPPTPINNPGLESMYAALRPTPSDYLYYLTDKQGVMHYAKTYAGHQENERLYLR